MGNAYFHLNPRCVSAKVATFDPAHVQVSNSLCQHLTASHKLLVYYTLGSQNPLMSMFLKFSLSFCYKTSFSETKSSQRNYLKYVTMRKGWLQNKRVYKIDEKNV